MLDPSAEQELLRRALARGWLRPADLQRTEPGSLGGDASVDARFSTRIDALLRAGYLTESAVQRLLDERNSPSPPLELEASQQADPALRNTDLSPATPAGARPAESPATELIPVENWEEYEIVELLGQGGMGTVYKARDKRLGRIVALKFIRRDRSMVARFMQEARAQARVTHENVCKVYEVGEVAGKPYIAMQFIEGVPLSGLVHKLTLEEKVQIMRDTAGALHAAHRLGIIHRDVKPGNVMVARNEDGSLRPVVMDFGLAYDDEEEDRLTRTGALLGTPAYMSPEQARGETHGLDRRTDVYSLDSSWKISDGKTRENAGLGTLQERSMIKKKRSFLGQVRGLQPLIQPIARAALEGQVCRDLHICGRSAQIRSAQIRNAWPFHID